MTDSFSVDLHALASAATGIDDLRRELQAQRVSSIDCDRAAFGHDRLAATVSDFCGRWQHGVAHLVEDGAQLAERLRHTVHAYQQADTTATQALLTAAAGLSTPAGPAGGVGAGQGVV